MNLKERGSLNRNHRLITIILFVIGVLLFSFSQVTAKEKKPNILLITVDSLRPDHLGCYGYKKDISPNIDRLAGEGVLFTQAIAQATWTWPSMHSIITGTYPSTHGINYWDKILTKSLLSLPDLLKRKKKYATGFMTGRGHFSLFATKNKEGFSRGFDTVLSISDRRADQLTEKALSWIDENKERSFFLWLHYMDVHFRFLVTAPFSGELLNKYRRDVFIRNYNGQIQFIDFNIGRLIAKLKELGLYNDTVIIVTADHGEEIGEHNSFFLHGASPWDCVIRVPLIVVYPESPFKDKTVNELVELVDIAPTVCDMAGIETADTAFEGKSLCQILKGGSGPLKKFAFAEVIDDKDGYTETCIRTADWKLFYINFVDPAQQEYELYNLKSDPEEKDNLADKEKIRFILMKRELEKWIDRQRPKVTSAIRPLNPDEKKNLRKLGYLQ